MIAIRAAAALALAAGVAAGAPAAYAAPPWAPPIDSGPPSNGLRVVGFGFTPAGLDMTGWVRFTQSIVGPGRATGAPGIQHRLAAPLAAGPVLDGTGRGILMTAQGPSASGRQQIAWARTTQRGAPGRLRPLRNASNLSSGPVLAMNARGDAVAAWTEHVFGPRSPGTYRTFASYRPRGGAFGRPAELFRTVPDADPNPVSAAIGRDGRAVVVEANGPRIRSRLRTRRSGFGAARSFGAQGGSTRTAAAISPRGRTIVAWGTQDAGIDANRPWVVSAARLRAGTSRFFVQTLDHGGEIGRPVGTIALEIGHDERATVAWSAIAHDARGSLAFPVMTARSDRNGFFSGRGVVAPSGAVGDVAIRADGATIITWARAQATHETDQAQAAVRPAGASAFGAPEELAPPDLAQPPLAAFNPVTGAPVAVWSGRPSGIDPRYPAGVETAVLRTATRTAP